MCFSDPGKLKPVFSVSIFCLQTSDNSISVTELPVRTWTQPYKEFLEAMLKGTTAAASTAASRAKKADKDKDDGGCDLLQPFIFHAHVCGTHDGAWFNLYAADARLLHCNHQMHDLRVTRTVAVSEDWAQQYSYACRSCFALCCVLQLRQTWSFQHISAQDSYNTWGFGSPFTFQRYDMCALLLLLQTSPARVLC